MANHIPGLGYFILPYSTQESSIANRQWEYIRSLSDGWCGYKSSHISEKVQKEAKEIYTHLIKLGFTNINIAPDPAGEIGLGIDLAGKRFLQVYVRPSGDFSLTLEDERDILIDEILQRNEVYNRVKEWTPSPRKDFFDSFATTGFQMKASLPTQPSKTLTDTYPLYVANA